MSPFIRDGIVAIEDARFYQHGGIDTTGILRALVATAQGGRQGASTITQQYVNNMIIESLVAQGKGDDVKLGYAKTIGDKLREMKLAIALEKTYSKDQILQGYLNVVYFGNGAYGIDAAAHEYFNVSASDLTLPEAAALAGVVNSPVYYDPLTEPDHVVSRRNEVLDKMLQQGDITAAQHDAASHAPIGLNVHPNRPGMLRRLNGTVFLRLRPAADSQRSRPFGADEAARKKLLYLGGLTIRTTLDPTLQKVAQDAGQRCHGRLRSLAARFLAGQRATWHRQGIDHGAEHRLQPRDGTGELHGKLRPSGARRKRPAARRRRRIPDRLHDEAVHLC